ncbi:MAG: MipA/OmpV family protein [Oxalobacteraceae bacterium]|nr:MipA/OmpV family protein [Oxalobacteraceae bacterium]
MKNFLLLAMATLLAGTTAHAQTALPQRLTGDAGAAVYATTANVRGASYRPSLLPYVYADYQRLFARTDTFGVKTVALGAGYLELVGRVSQEGYKADSAALRGLRDRSTPVPLGIGTYQETPYGGFFVYAMHDVSSGGSLLEATYAAEFSFAGFKIYPQVGVERRSAAYVQHVYGVDAAESARSGIASYRAGASTVPVAGLAAELSLGGPWHLLVQARRSWLDAAIRDSPLVSTRTQTNGFVAVTYAFK